MKRRARLLSVVGVIGATAGAALPATSGAAVDSKVTLKVKSPSRFVGYVKSASPECVVARKVVLRRVGPFGNEKVGKSFASESGRYVIRVNPGLPNGAAVFAKIRGTETGPLCRGDKSPTKTV